MSHPLHVGGPDGSYPTAPAGSSDCEGIPEETLLAAASGLKQISTGSQTVVKHSLPDLIALDKHLKSKCAANGAGAWGSVRLAKVVPPSATGDC